MDQKAADWDFHIKNFCAYLKLERGLSTNSIAAYAGDVKKLRKYVLSLEEKFSPLRVKVVHIRDFIAQTHHSNSSAFSQARRISGIKAFYKYLVFEEFIKDDPSELIEGPKLGQKLPDTLHYHEIEALLDAIDLSLPEGTRNRAMIEVLYSSGLRVSELVNLRVDHVDFNNGFLRVIGKGNKERLAPVGKTALKYLRMYKSDFRYQLPIQKNFESFFFLNRRGKKLTRNMVFIIIRQLSAKIGLKKLISPHTFRHSFATHMIEGGADLRVVQDILGHESITTTQIYTHLDKQYLRQVIREFHPRS